MLLPTRILLFLGLLLAQTDITVADEIEPCTLCAGGGAVSDPEKIILGTNYSCGEVQLFAFFLEPDKCNFTNEGLDVPYYCGCADAVAPNVCSLCGEDAVFADRMLTFGFNDTTCGELDESVDAVNNSTMCQDFEPYRGLCCDTDEPPTCSICQNGEEMGEPNRGIPLLEGTTCEEFNSLLSVVPEEECTIEKHLIDDFELDALCGCPNTTAPNVCSLCGDLPLIKDADKVVIPDHDSLTCQLANDMAPFFATVEECTKDPYTEVQSICCVGAPAFTCSICPSEESVGNPNVFIPFNVNQTCDEADLNFFRGLVAGECSATKDEATPLDLTALCGCEGASSQGLCTLCGDLEFNKDAANVMLADSGGLSCQAAFDLISFTNDDDYCEETVPLLREQCCFDPNAPTVAPSVPPGNDRTATPSIITAVPTAAPTGGATSLPTSGPNGATVAPTTDPSPSTMPSDVPSSVPTSPPTNLPTLAPVPAASPSTSPSLSPSRLPTIPPASKPSKLSTKPPAKEPTLSESTEFTCSICPEGSTMEEPDLAFTFLNNLTCTQVERQTLAALDQSTCLAVKAQLPIDMAAVCSCSNFTSSSSGVKCELCVEGSSLIENADKVTLVNEALLPETSFSCSDAASLIPYVDNEDFCTIEVPLIRLACCDFVGSSGATRTVSYGLAALLQLGVLVLTFI